MLLYKIRYAYMVCCYAMLSCAAESTAFRVQFVLKRVSMGFDSGRISSRRKSTIKIITPPPRALRFLGPCRSMPLPPAYAMSGTELRIVLRVSYAISGTGVVCMVLTWRVEYGATRALCAVSY